MDIFWIILAAIVVLNILAFVGAIAYNYSYTFKARKRNGPIDYYRNIDKGGYSGYTDTVRGYLDKLLSLPYKDVYITSFDGLRLHARYYKGNDGAPVEILFHGYRSSGVRDFCFGALAAIERGDSLLLVDQRSHGESEGRFVAFGVLERYDVKSWVDYALSEFGKDASILLYGISMGAATVLSSLSLELPGNVKGIFADCPFSSARDIIYKVSAEIGVPRVMMRLMLSPTARLFCGFNIDATSAKRAVVGKDIPILLIHTKTDAFVPFSMSEEISGANPRIRFEPFDAGDHALAYLWDNQRYSALLSEFKNQIFGGESK